MVERTKSYLRYYWQDYTTRKGAWDRYGIKPEVLTCIAWADTSLGYAMKSTNNPWNVGNTDSWKVVHFESMSQWIGAIAQTLTNKYLGKKMTIGDLSYAGSCIIDCDKVYATSNDNWQTNVLNCLSNINEKKIEANFLFRK